MQRAGDGDRQSAKNKVGFSGDGDGADRDSDGGGEGQ